MAAAPITWTADGTATDAADLNAHLRDQMVEMDHQIVQAAGDLVYATGQRTISRISTASTEPAPRILRSNGPIPAWRGIVASMPALAAAKFAPNALLPADGELTAAHLATLVDAIPAGEFGTAQFADDAITEAKVADGAITANLGTAGIPETLLADGVVDLIYRRQLGTIGGERRRNLFADNTTFTHTVHLRPALNTTRTLSVAYPGMVSPPTSPDVTLLLDPYERSYIERQEIIDSDINITLEDTETSPVSVTYTSESTPTVQVASATYSTQTVSQSEAFALQPTVQAAVDGWLSNARTRFIGREYSFSSNVTVRVLSVATAYVIGTAIVTRSLPPVTEISTRSLPLSAQATLNLPTTKIPTITIRGRGITGYDATRTSDASRTATLTLQATALDLIPAFGVQYAEDGSLVEFTISNTGVLGTRALT